ncbi:hypothetical protein V2J09_012139 [Rumex salicifolius]
METSAVDFSHHRGRRHHHQIPVIFKNHTQNQMMMKKPIAQQRKENLLAEVSMQQKMLTHQQKIRSVLQYLHDRKDCTPLEIPDLIPPEVKGLVVEIATVEDEIIRLENQIQHLKIEVIQDQEATTRTRDYLNQSQKLNNNSINANNSDGGYFSLQQLITRSDVDVVSSDLRATDNPDDHDQKVGFDNKALHFISKAINGNYSLNDFTDKASSSPSLVVTSQKENRVLHKETSFQERPKDRINLSEFPLDLPRKSTTNIPTIVGQLVPSKETSTTTNQGGQRVIPNKLSENILKCLILIYVRLMRTSRQLELEKSGPISSRSTISSLSFRADATGNNQMLSTSLILQKEYSRQQDPYGIFNVEDSIPRDIGPYKNLVVFSSTSLDPKCVSNSTSIPLFQKLRGMLNSLQTVDLASLSNQQKLAFWINMYNSCILHGYLQYGVPSSPTKLLSLMNKATLNIGGNVVNAQAIEHYILRKPSSSSITKEAESVKVDKSGKESVIRELYGLESPNPNVIFALSCGTRSSPGVSVISELEKSKLDYLQASISVTNTKKIALPELLTQNMLEFASDMENLLEWVCHQLPTSGSLRKSIVDCFRLGNQQQANNGASTTRNLTSTSTIVINLPYEFDFQYLLAI